MKEQGLLKSDDILHGISIMWVIFILKELHSIITDLDAVPDCNFDFVRRDRLVAITNFIESRLLEFLDCVIR